MTVLAGLAVTVLTAMTFLNLGAGYELGDHGYYLLHVRQPDQLTHVVTHFGYVWRAFVGDHAIVVNRALNAALVLAAGIVLAESLRPCGTGVGWAKPALVGAGAFSTYFAAFIIDPSYNSLTLILLAFILAMAGAMLRGFSILAVWKLLAMACASGAMVAALVLSKATSALAISLYLAAAFVVVAQIGKKPMRLVPLVLGGVAGAGLFLFWLAARGVSFAHLFESFRDGYHAFSTSGGHSTRLILSGVVDRLLDFARASISAFHHGGWALGMPAAAAVCLSLMSGRASVRMAPVLVLLNGIVLAVTAGMILVGGEEAFFRAGMLTLFNIGGLAALALLILRGRATAMPEVLTWTGAILLPFCAAVGTINNYANQALFLGAGLPLLPAFSIAASCPGATRRWMEATLLTLLTSVVALSAMAMYEFPYRIAGSLQDATRPEVLPGGEVIRVTPPVANFLEALRPEAYRGPAADGPMIFDLTEQLPFAVTFLNGRPPGAAWFTGNMNKSFSAEVFASLRDRDILNGWILVAQSTAQGQKPMAHFSSFLDRLQKMGVRFEDHYVEVASAVAPDWGDRSSTIRVSLFKPRP